MLPSVVLLATLRLSLLPILAFKSLSSEHASKAAFYKPLFAFLHTPATDAAEEEDGLPPPRSLHLHPHAPPPP